MDRSLKRLVLAAREIRRRRLSGFPFQTSEILQIEFLATLMRDEAIESQEILNQKEHTALLKASLGFKS